MLGAHHVGGAADRVEQRSRAIGRDVADERYEFVLRAIHRPQLVRGRAQFLAGAKRDHGRFQPREVAFEFGGGGIGDAKRRRVAVGVAWHHLAIAKVVAIFQPVGEIHAKRDWVIEPDFHQPLADRERDQPLRRLPRNRQFPGDLVLGVAGNIIKPAGARRVVEAKGVAFNAAPQQSLSRKS